MDTDGGLFILYYLHYTKGSNTINTYFMTNNLPIQIFRLNPEQWKEKIQGRGVLLNKKTA